MRVTIDTYIVNQANVAIRENVTVVADRTAGIVGNA